VAFGVLFTLNLLATAWEIRKHGTFRILGRPAGTFEGQAPPGQAPDLRPGAHIAGAAHDVVVNSMGFRSPELREPRPPGGVRVWCLGGSTTFDIGVSTNAQTWPAQAEARLRARLPGRSIEVLNAGVPGEVLEGNLRDLQKWGMRVRPDVVVVYYGPNDLGRALDATLGAAPTPKAWLSDIALYRMASDWLPARVGPDDWKAHAPGEAVLSRIDAEAQRVVDEARRLGARVVLASHALNADPSDTGWTARRRVGREAWVKRLLPEDYIAAIDAINARARLLAERQGLGFVDLRAAVPPSDDHFDDGIHFKDAGAALAGVAVADALVDGGFVRAQGAPVGPGR
jgi:lysophospholipase L1-like esterase